jgi:hypothetical protein
MKKKHAYMIVTKDKENIASAHTGTLLPIYWNKEIAFRNCNDTFHKVIRVKIQNA